MSLWVKICGLTTPAGVAAAVEAGADAVGFVFAPSKRRIEPQRAAVLAANVTAMRVAVMLHPTQAQLDEVCEQFKPDALQTDLEDLATLRVPAGLRVLPVLRSHHAASAALPDAHPGPVFFEGPVSGAGQLGDWDAAARLARSTRLVLAGGLDPDNVDSAIRRVRPYGVDVSSGVESAPGVKDPHEIERFVRNARAAQMGATR